MNEKQARRLRQAARHPAPAPQNLGPQLYLDTSVLRSAGARLKEINRRKDAVTSVVSIQELLNGIRADQGSFSRRRGTLRNIAEAGVFVDWRTEEAFLLATFGLTNALVPGFTKVASKQIELPIKRIMRVALSVHDVEQFRRELREQSLEPALEKIEMYDQSISTHWVASTSQGHHECKQTLDEINAGKRSRHPEMGYSTTQEFSELMQGERWSLNRLISIRALAARVSRLLNLWNPSQRVLPLEKLVPFYNGRADVYISAHALWWVKKYATMGTPGRNDGMDLLHFLYAGNRTIFLTEDGRQGDIAKSVCHSAMTMDEYLGTLTDMAAR